MATSMTPQPRTRTNRKPKPARRTRHSARITHTIGLGIALVLTSTTHAHTTPPPAYQLAAQQAGVPVTMLYAIALQESGMNLQGRHVPWPWSLNVAGQTQRFPNRAAACAAMKRALQQFKPTQVDAGLAQVNVGYQQHRYQEPCELLNPYRNLRIAAQILLEQHQPGQDWLTTAGRYHRPAGGEPAARYRAGVSQHLERLQTVAPNTPPIKPIAAKAPLSSKPPSASPNSLIVVEDLGGTSALPYYEALNLQPRPDHASTTPQQ